MRLVFFGTPEFASISLKAILDSRHQVVGVVTAPDKPKGRGKKLESSEVKKLSLKHDLHLFQPADLKDHDFISSLRKIEADLFCVVAFRILPEDVFMIPPKGCVNLHGSLLPRYRGAAPINWALINGEAETGLTSFFIRKQVDTGDMILQEKITIGSDETFAELHDRMALKGSALLIKTIDTIEAGNFEAIKQDKSLATPAPKLQQGIGLIDWSKTSIEIHNLIRGLSPRPGAYSYYAQKKHLIIRSRISIENSSDTKAGKIIEADPRHGIKISCGTGIIEIMEIKPESGKIISGADFVKGFRPKAGEFFGKE